MTLNKTNGTETKRKGNVQINITLKDNVGLSHYIFSWNGTGAWLNDSIVYLNGEKEANISINKTVNLTNGFVVGWMVYMNDTSDNKNNTNIFTFRIANSPPTKPVLISPKNGISIPKNYTLLKYNYFL